MRFSLIGACALVAISPAFGGCATTISAIKARPVAAHDAHITRLWTSTGERRFVTWLYRGENKFLLCPEPVPFTAQTITSSAKPSLARPELVTISTDEAYGTGLTTIGTLTENLAALDRNFSNACNLYVAGIITASDFASHVAEDNKLRRNYVLLSALKPAEDKVLKAKIDAVVKEAIDKLKKDLASSDAGRPNPPQPQSK